MFIFKKKYMIYKEIKYCPHMGKRAVSRNSTSDAQMLPLLDKDFNHLF